MALKAGGTRPGDGAEELKLELLCTHAAVRKARSLVRHFGRLHGLPDVEVERLMLVASELLGNAVDHGGGDAALEDAQAKRGAHMQLALVLDAERWTLEVADEGRGDAGQLESMLHPPQAPGIEQERGRGMFLVEQLVDRVDVRRRRDGRGLLVRATRRHAGAD